MTDFAASAARFAADTRGHELTVLFEQGLYRHLRFASPDGSGYRFDLHTSPNRLMFHGEPGTFVFSVWPTEDMFQLFRESSVGDQPNFAYLHADAEPWETQFKFSDNARWVLDDYDWRYLWACHAGLWGANQYCAAKAVTV